MRTIGVVTVARSDYGIYRPILKKIQADPELKLHLIVTGMHLSPEFGMTVNEIEEDGFPAGDRFEMLLSSDTPESIAKSIGLGVISFSQSFRRRSPDILMVLGDRFEMMAAVVAALPFNMPIAHVHGGEATEGLIDEAVRHSITKMSHLHFVSTQEYANRVIQMGEEPWRVTVSGAPALDNLRDLDPLVTEELVSIIGLPVDPPPLLVTFHPVTLEYENTQKHIIELLKALSQLNLPVVFTYPNSDTFGRKIINAIEEYLREHSNCVAVENLGTRAYFSLMKSALAMVGNSSSGIIEAASFGLPVVDIGPRQQGRVRARNVIHCPHDTDSIVNSVKRAIEPDFKKSLKGIKNPYGDGTAAEKIVPIIKTSKLNSSLIVKIFNDIDMVSK